MKKQNKGITLVALVVTIVVLLILAGVSISTVLGENGLITQARKAAKDTNTAQEAELTAIDKLEIQTAESTGAMRTTSSKYATVWPYNTGKNEDNTDVDSGDYDTASRAHYTFGKNLANKIYGSAVFETSNLGSGANSWHNDYSVFPALSHSFFYRGGRWDRGAGAGLFAFSRYIGLPNFYYGFRAVLV